MFDKDRQYNGKGDGETMNIPTSYKEGYETAQPSDRELAKRYVDHTVIGDPLADRLIAETGEIGSKEVERYIGLGMQKETASEIRKAPDAIREFFEFCYDVPDWVDLDSYQDGCRMFHRNTRLVLAGMVGGVLIEGFATNIAKSFFLTGRLRDKGVRRLQQNNRHMVEIFMPDGMRVFNDGWAYSVRIRLVHAKVRRLISLSSEWDDEALGIPISSANLGLALASFSARLIYHIQRLGASFKAGEREAFMSIWRYSGYLMGIPESILFTSEDEANEIFRVGHICEPSPSFESIALASSIINSAPLFAGMTQPKDRQNMAHYISMVSRALIGDQIADDLMIDCKSQFALLWKFKWLYRLENLLTKVKPSRAPQNNNMLTILDISAYDPQGMSLALPDHVYAERSSNW